MDPAGYGCRLCGLPQPEMVVLVHSDSGARAAACRRCTGTALRFPAAAASTSGAARLRSAQNVGYEAWLDGATAYLLEAEASQRLLPTRPHDYL